MTSHDFNYNEAVNFCLPDWLTEDLNCVNKYKEMSKAPVFSHDELLVTIFCHEKSPKASRWLLPLFDEMVKRELSRRQRARDEIPCLLEILEDEGYCDEHYQCQVDKSFCYLSQLTTEEAEPGHVVCIDHHETLDIAKPRTMKIRFSDEELKAMLARVKQRANNRTAERVKGKEAMVEVPQKVSAPCSYFVKRSL